MKLTNNGSYWLAEMRLGRYATIMVSADTPSDAMRVMYETVANFRGHRDVRRF